MIKLVLAFLVCLPLPLISTVTPIPEWVKPYDFSLEPVDIKLAQYDLQPLLIDEQVHIEKKARFIHRVFKITGKVGRNSVSKLEFDFDPLYQEISVHHIQIYRDGKWSSRLKTARQKILQQEEDKGKDIYRGQSTLVYFLNDIRIGDIIDYSYTLEDKKELFGSDFFSELIQLQLRGFVEKKCVRYIASSKRPLVYKSFNSSIEPQITDLTKNLKEYEIVVLASDVCEKEINSPYWYTPCGMLQICEKKNWHDIALDLLPAYSINDGLIQQPSEEMQTLVDEWMQKTQNPLQRASLALHFVQRELRYLSLGVDLDKFVPRDPRAVLEQKYGDCKDKSLLLCTLLHFMGIKATCALVDTKKGPTLSEFLPDPYIFNHAIVKIEIDGRTFWVDPTVEDQVGKLEDSYLPNYTWALPISDETEQLEKIAAKDDKVEIDFDISIIIDANDAATLKIKRIFSGLSANVHRGNEKHMLGSVQARYLGAVELSPISVEDDLENNILTFTEAYSFPLEQDEDGYILPVKSWTLNSYLKDSIDPDRKSPYSLLYPFWTKEHIQIQFLSDEKIPFAKELSEYSHESMHVTRRSYEKGNCYDFYYELKHLKDHVRPEAIEEYNKMVDEIDDDSFCEINWSLKKPSLVSKFRQILISLCE